jgi:CheY-like chemotaxis protein/nitrogen-specific signal transduction histidine kinase
MAELIGTLSLEKAFRLASEERLKVQQKNLISIAEDAGAANRAKGEFLANMSHEIRTPMNAIIGLTRLALETGLPPRQQDYLSKIHTSARALLGILNDILDYSKIDAGRLELEQIDFSLKQVLDQLANLFGNTAEEKGLELIFEVSPEVPEYLRGDPLRLAQVLNNLLGNAIKFTARGRVRLRIEMLQPECGDDIRLNFIVQDSGIGIAEEKKAKLFQAFSQADATITRHYGGTGLGLAIARHLVNMMGGKITVESEIGVGSTFSFTASFRPVAEPPAESGVANDLLSAVLVSPSVLRKKAAPLKGARILLVEDNEINQQVARENLAAWQVEVDIAAEGFAAVEMALNNQYQAILMDLQMPGLDGLSATRQIRAYAAGRKVPIIALTAAVMAHEKEACAAAGMNDHIAKPLVPEELLEVLLRWVEPVPAGKERDSYKEQEKDFVVLSVVDEDETLLPELPGFDLETALARVQGKRSLLARLLRSFAEQHQELLERCRKSLQAGDFTAAAREIHTIKGMAANLGAQELVACAQRLELELKAGSDESFSAFAELFILTAAAIRERISTPAVSPREPLELDREHLGSILDRVRNILEEYGVVSEALKTELQACLQGHCREMLVERLLQQLHDFAYTEAQETCALIMSELEPEK